MGKTPEGLRNSSQNATRHGVLSQRKLLPDEDQAEFEACERGWLETYGPRDYREARLVEQLILNDWFLRRATRRLLQVEAEGGEGAEFEHRLGLMQRYKTAAERAFYRAQGAVEGLRKDLIREQMRIERLLATQQKAEAKAAEKARRPEPTKAGRKMELAEQWVEVRVNEKGETETEVFPSHEELEKLVEKLDPERDLVYRRFHFVDGVPEEYAWTTTDPLVREIGGAGIQRMRPETWFEQREREVREGNGHLLGCADTVARPKERGGCDCETCRAKREEEDEEEEED